MAIFHGTADGVKSNLRFERCQFTSNRRHGVSLDSATDVWFTETTFDNNGLDIGASEGEQGARSGGSLYGNGIDIEEYDASHYAADVHFDRCSGVGNAREAVLAYAGTSLSDAPDWQPRSGFTFDRCLFDAGVDPSSSSLAVLFTPLPDNKALGYYYDDVTVRDSELRGGLGLRAVDTAAITGRSVLTSTNDYAGMADHCGTLTVASTVQRYGKGIYADTSTVIYA
jgi:hypothetical protein